MRIVGFASAGLLVVLAACNTGSKEPGSSESKAAGSAGTSEPAAAPNAGASSAATSASGAPSDGALRLGAPIDASTQKVALADVAKAPQSYVGKTFTTTGTVTAVCQHMGCWMEIKDDAGEAHIKMAGHSFFVPKTASGRKARVLATLVKSEGGNGACADEGDEGKMAAAGSAPAEKPAANGKSGCRAEAEAQLGRPLAKLELVAQGVELM